MSEPTLPDLFAHAGITLDPGTVQPMPKRQRRPRAPSPAQRAAVVRLEGARRLRAPHGVGQRSRVGQPRDLSPAPVLAFPLARNAGVVSEMIERLGSGNGASLDAAYDREARNLEKRLVRRGLHKQSARRCAMDVLHEAYIKTLRQRKERQE